MYLHDNYYIRDFLRKSKNYSINSRVGWLIKETQQIDSIQDYQTFKRFIIKNVKSKPMGGLLMQAEFGSEGLLYGHRNAFFEYADMGTDKQRFLFPYFEHGADLREKGVSNILESGNHSFVFQAPYKNQIVHRMRPMSPVYNIGPYILYAKSYYEEHAFKKLKQENKKTALLFPAHTFENASIEFDKRKFVSDVFTLFKEQYDTIMICVYWNDVDDPIYDAFETAGAKLVSAGFRGDPNFIVRQRAMIELSDVVASNLTGSYIGYSMALEKPLYLFTDRATLISNDNLGNSEEETRYAHTINEIFDAFSSLEPTATHIDKQQCLYEKFWGGRKYFKSKEDARKIIGTSQKLLKVCKGTTKGYELAILDVLRGNNKAGLTEAETQILIDSLSVDI